MRFLSKWRESVICFMVVTIFFSCQHNQVMDDVVEGATNIRVHNASFYDFENVEINPFNEPTNFGDVRRGEKTGYQPFEIAYRYAYVRLFIDDKEFIIQPIDYVGETPLGPGKFTYVLKVVDFKNRILDISAVKDD